MKSNYEERKLINQLKNIVFMSDEQLNAVAIESCQAGIDIEDYIAHDSELFMPDIINALVI